MSAVEGTRTFQAGGNAYDRFMGVARAASGVVPV